MDEAFQGFCPICRQNTTFRARTNWYRDMLVCTSCKGGSVPRERALALVMSEAVPDWREKRIHESSPVMRGISARMADECADYVASQFYTDKPLGTMVGNFRNENLEQQTFADESLDIVVSLDVMEHVYNPDRAFVEIWRTLAPGGYHICTFPTRKAAVKGAERRFVYGEKGERIDHKPPEFHGNPIDAAGSIVTFDYGYDIHHTIAGWAPFDVRVMRFNDRTHGIIGEYTEVYLCRKRSG